MSSYKAGKPEAIEWIKQHFKKGETCLDVGACDGKWADLLQGYLKIDGIEAYKPNIINHFLYPKYNGIFCADIREFQYEWYDLIIFGDVIEHLTVSDAQRVISYAWDRCRDMIIAVPFLHEQGAKYGNPYEVHQQPDLTPEIFDQRYKGFKPFFITEKYAYYTKK